jgi:hypothetical protein
VNKKISLKISKTDYYYLQLPILIGKMAVKIKSDTQGMTMGPIG